jgi:hypothetical protein
VSAPNERSVRRRRAAIGVGFLVMFLFALGVFLLPFAFPTEGAIVARFASTAAFSPNTPGGRATLPVSVQMRDPGTVRLLVTQGSKTIRTLLPPTKVRKGWTIVSWNGRNDRGVPVPDGAYTIQLSATSGRKGYNASRRAYVDRTRPPAPRLVVTSAGAGTLPVGAQCVVNATPSTYARFIFVVQHLPGGSVISGPRFTTADTPLAWEWSGRGPHGVVLTPGLYRVIIETLSVNGFESMAARQCWIGNLLGALASPVATGGVATVHLATPTGIALPTATPVRLQVLRRLGTPGIPGPTIGRPIGASVTTSAGNARIRLPHGVPPADLWIEAHAGARTALVAAGTRP